MHRLLKECLIKPGNATAAEHEVVLKEFEALLIQLEEEENRPKYNKEEDFQAMNEDILLDRMHSHMANGTIGTVCDSIMSLQLAALINGSMSEEEIISNFRSWVILTAALRSELNNPTTRGKHLPAPLTDEEIERALNLKKKPPKVEMPENPTIN